MPREKAVMGPSKPLKTGFWTSFRRGVCNLIGNHAHEDMISMILSDIKQIYTLEDFFKYTFDPYGKGGLVYLQDRTYPEALRGTEIPIRVTTSSIGVHEINFELPEIIDNPIIQKALREQFNYLWQNHLVTLENEIMRAILTIEYLIAKTDIADLKCLARHCNVPLLTLLESFPYIGADNRLHPTTPSESIGVGFYRVTKNSQGESYIQRLEALHLRASRFKEATLLSPGTDKHHIIHNIFRFNGTVDPQFEVVAQPPFANPNEPSTNVYFSNRHNPALQDQFKDDLIERSNGIATSNQVAGDHMLFLKVHSYGDTEYYQMLLVPHLFGLTEQMSKFAELTDHLQQLSLQFSIRDEQVKAAAAANMAKSMFLANMSHEIRTPLNAMVGLAELLADAKLSGELAQYAETIRRQGEHLGIIVNDILDLSKIEAAQVRLEEIPIIIRSFAIETLSLLQQRADKKGISLEIKIDEAVPEAIFCDPVRLSQVLINLIGNALKFTETGSVTLEITKQNLEAQSQRSETVYLNISVRDTGIGIPTDKLDGIFNPFEQADGSTTRKFGGTGLGLSISARLVELMGGNLKAHSTEKKGSVFHFRVPFKTVSPEAVERPKPTTQQTSIFQNQSVLIVDDGHENRVVLSAMIERRGGKATAVSSGLEALDLLKLQSFDLILLDLHMPEMDGYQVAQEIRRKDGNVPIVAVSADTMGNIREKCIKAGMNNYLAKPVTSVKLEDAVSKLLMPKSELSENPLSGLRFLIVEDDPSMNMLINRILARSGATCVIASTGEAAIEQINSGTRFDLVLMDFGLPDISGFEAASQIRSLMHELPIIGFSANLDPEDKTRAFESGMREILLKQASTMRADIIELAQRLNLIGDTAINSDLPSNSAVPVVLDIDVLNQLELETDRDTVLEIISILMKYTPERIEAIKVNLDTGKMREAQEIAHPLKSSIANLGGRLKDVVGQLEAACKQEKLEEANRLIQIIEADWPLLRQALEDYVKSLNP